MSVYTTYEGIHQLVEVHPATVAKLMRIAKAHLCRGFHGHFSLDWRRRKKLQWVSAFFHGEAAPWSSGFDFLPAVPAFIDR